jgi:hypothetical protein
MRLSLDHRWGRRKVTDAPVRFVALPATFGLGRITNVSVTGAFMETYAKLPLAAVVHLESIDSNNGVPRQRLTANVVRVDAHGVGLEWQECASNSTLFAQFGSAYRDRADFSRPPPTGGDEQGLRYYQFDFRD